MDGGGTARSGFVWYGRECFVSSRIGRVRNVLVRQCLVSCGTVGFGVVLWGNDRRVKMSVAVLYLRFSERPNAEECESLDFQRDVLTEFCLGHDYQIIAERADEDISGSSREGRVGLEEAVSLAIEHRATLLCYNQSRLARSTRDTLNLAHELQQGGASLKLLDCSLDTSTPEGEMLLTSMAMTSQFLLRGLRKATSDSMQRRQRRGQLVSGNPPFGFSVRLESQYTQRGEELIRLLVPVQSEQAVLAEIYKMDKLGHSPASIRKSLSDLGETFRGRPFRTRDVANILRRRLDVVPPGPVWDPGSPIQAESLTNAG